MRFSILSVLTAAFVATSYAACISSSQPQAGDYSLQVLRSTGLAYYRRGQLGNAIRCYQAAFETARALGALNMSSISDLGNLGGLAEEQGRYNEASRYYTDALALLGALGQTNSVVAGHIHERLGGLLLLEGKLAEAEAAYKETIARLAHGSGRESIHVAEAMRDLGRLYLELGRVREAARLSTDARRIAEKTLPKGDPILITFLDVEATVLFDSGKYSAAEQRWLDALGIADRTHGQNSRQSFGVLMHLGQMYRLIGDFESAADMLDRSRTAQSRFVDSDPLDRALILSLLADTFAHRRKYAEAESFAAQARQDAENTCDMTPLACGNLRSVLGDYYMLTKQWAKAEREYSSALTLREAVLGESPLTANALMSLSRALHKLKRKKEARRLKNEAVRIMTARPELYRDQANTVDIRALRSGRP